MKERKNVELVMSVGGIRNLVRWLTDYKEHLNGDDTLNDFVGYLNQVLEVNKAYE